MQSAHFVNLCSAVHFTNPFCCSKHDDGFRLADFFPGTFLSDESFIFIKQDTNTLALRAKYRPVKERELLKAALYAWRSRMHQNDPLRGVRQISWIISDSEIELICKTPQATLTNVEELKSRLDVSSDWVEEWGLKLVDEIQTANDAFNASLNASV